MVVSADKTGFGLHGRSNGPLYATKQPGFVVDVGREAVEYLKGCSNMELIYGPCEDGEEGGPTGVLSFPRSMKRLEIFADASFAPQSSRSIQGILACYGGAIVQWESSRQTICSMSTAEAELYSYVESLVMADRVAGIIQELEGLGGVKKKFIGFSMGTTWRQSPY